MAAANLGDRGFGQLDANSDGHGLSPLHHYPLLPCSCAFRKAPPYWQAAPASVFRFTLELRRSSPGLEELRDARGGALWGLAGFPVHHGHADLKRGPDGFSVLETGVGTREVFGNPLGGRERLALRQADLSDELFAAPTPERGVGGQAVPQPFAEGPG